MNEETMHFYREIKFNHSTPLIKDLVDNNWPTIILTKINKPENRVLIFRTLRDSFFKFDVYEAGTKMDGLPVNLGRLPQRKAEELQKELKRYGAFTTIRCMEDEETSHQPLKLE